MRSEALLSPAVLAAGVAWILPVFVPPSAGGGVLLDWGAPALFLAAAAAWHAGLRPAPSGWRAWAVLGLLLAPALLLPVFGDIRAPGRLFRWSALLALAWLAFALARAGGDRLWRAPAWRAAWVVPALVQALLMLATVRGQDAAWAGLVDGRGGVFKQANWQALAFVIALGVLAPRLARPRARAAIAAAALLVAGVWFTGSRSGFVTLLAVAALALAFEREARARAALRWLLASAAGVALAVAVEALGAPGAAPTRAMGTGSFAGRWMIWLLAWRTFLAHPFAGVGWGGLAAHGADALEQVLAAHPGLAAVAARVVGAHAYAHDWVLQALAEAGLFGAVAAIGLVMGFWRKARMLASHADEARVAPFLVVAAIVVHGLVSVSAAQPFFWFAFALAAAGVWPLRAQPTRGFSPARLAWFAPALAVAVLAAHEVRAAERMDRAFAAPLSSRAFLEGAARATEDPWLHATALHRLFVKLARERATARQWAAAEPFAWALWRVAQEPNYCMIFIIVAHAKDDVLAERRWAARYLRLRPGFPPALAAYHHAWNEHGAKPLEVVRTW